MTEQVPTVHRSPPPTRRILQGLGSLVLIVAIFWFLFTGIAFGQVWAAIRALTWLELATLAAIAGWNLCTYALVWMSVTPPTPLCGCRSLPGWASGRRWS